MIRRKKPEKVLLVLVAADRIPDSVKRGPQGQISGGTGSYQQLSPNLGVDVPQEDFGTTTAGSFNEKAVLRPNGATTYIKMTYGSILAAP